MRFILDQAGGNRIRAYETGCVTINEVRHTRSMVVSPEQPVVDWPPQSFEELETAHFTQLAHGEPEVVIFGSGERLRFPAAELIAGLVQLGIGVEVMDTAAACRTYNILAGDGRRVVAALLLAQAGRE